MIVLHLLIQHRQSVNSKIGLEDLQSMIQLMKNSAATLVPVSFSTKTTLMMSMFVKSSNHLCVTNLSSMTLLWNCHPLRLKVWHMYLQCKLCVIQFGSHSQGTTPLTNCSLFCSVLPHDGISYEETVYGDLKDLPFEELPVKEDFLFDTRCEYSFELYLQLSTVLSLYSYSHLSYCHT